MTVMNDDVSSLPIDTINGFTYDIRAAPALALPVDRLTMVGAAQDMGRGVLHLISASWQGTPACPALQRGAPIPCEMP